MLYTVVILKKFADGFKSACRERRYVVRDFAYDPAAAGSGARVAAQLQVEMAATLGLLREQSALKYAEIVSLWLHLKAVRLYTDSLLRYGPVSITVALFRVHKGGANSKKLMEAVQDTWNNVKGGFSVFDDAYAERKDKAGGKPGKGGAGADPVIPGISDAGATFPFIFYDFDLRIDTGSSAK